MMQFNVITIFPDLIFQYCHESILKRAQENMLIAVRALDLRDFTTDRHQKVDDTPYGGGAGMVMKPEPIYRVLERLGALRTDFSNQTSAISKKSKTKKSRSPKSEVRKLTVLLSPRGRQFDQRLAEEWSGLDEMIFVCVRYEGVDQRVVDHMVDEEISVGPYVLAGGELGALVIIEAVARLIPGVLGNEESLREETHSLTVLQSYSLTDRSSVRPSTVDQVEYPHYTKPADFKGWKVPDVLLSGDHKKIEEWRHKQ